MSASSAARPRSPAAPLDRLASATTWYARSGQLGFGLGLLPAVAAMFAGAAAGWNGAPLLGVAIVSTAPPLALLGGAAARRWYQRIGRAIAPDPGEGRGLMAAVGRGMIWLWWASSAAMLALVIFAGDSTKDAQPLALSYGSAALTRSLLRRVELRRGEMLLFYVAFVGLVLTNPTRLPAPGPTQWAWGLIGFAALGTLAAIWHHVMYLRACRVLTEASAAKDASPQDQAARP